MLNKCGWKIVGAECGRDKNGAFVCVCGECIRLLGEQGDKRNYDTGNRCNGSNDRKNDC